MHPFQVLVAGVAYGTPDVRTSAGVYVAFVLVGRHVCSYFPEAVVHVLALPLPVQEQMLVLVLVHWQALPTHLVQLL